jgi:hypothetical protein
LQAIKLVLIQRKHCGQRSITHWASKIGQVRVGTFIVFAAAGEKWGSAGDEKIRRTGVNALAHMEKRAHHRWLQRTNAELVILLPLLTHYEVALEQNAVTQKHVHRVKRARGQQQPYCTKDLFL